VWSKAERFVEGLHVVGDIISKINVNYVINLHAALLFTCSILWVYPMRGYNCLYDYGYFLHMLHVYGYCYFSLNLCFYIMYLSVYILYMKFHKDFLCI
jgi:hypothetical protein